MVIVEKRTCKRDGCVNVFDVVFETTCGNRGDKYYCGDRCRNKVDNDKRVAKGKNENAKRMRAEKWAAMPVRVCRCGTRLDVSAPHQRKWCTDKCRERHCSAKKRQTDYENVRAITARSLKKNKHKYQHTIRRYIQNKAAFNAYAEMRHLIKQAENL